MASPTRWTWVWVDFGSWWWTGRPGVLQFMGSQRVGHDWVTEWNWTETNIIIWSKPHSLWRRKTDTKLSDCPGSYSYLITSEVKNHNSHSISCLIFKTSILFLKLYCELGLPGGSDGEKSARNARNLGLIPGLGRSPGEWNGYPLQYSCLENSMDRGAWWTTVHGVTESDMTELLTLSYYE